MKPKVRQGGPFYALHDVDDLNLILDQQGVRNAVERVVSGKVKDFDELDALLADRRVQNFFGVVHQRMRRRSVEDASLLDPRTFLIFGPKSVLTGLKEAVEAGIADNYTYHFAATATFLYRLLEKHGLLDEVEKARSEPYAQVQEFAKKLLSG